MWRWPGTIAEQINKWTSENRRIATLKL